MTNLMDWLLDQATPIVVCFGIAALAALLVGEAYDRIKK